MPDITEHCSYFKQFFGDGEYPFALPYDQLTELEDKHGPAFALHNLLLAQAIAKLTTIADIIRLGLIGGGMKPVDAHSLAKRYSENRPIMESAPLAAEILNARIFGTEAWQKTPAGLESAARTAAQSGLPVQ